jgi:CheY-like chemotaxis protein
MDQPLKILLIDDDDINNFLTSELFSIYDCKIDISSVQYVEDALDLLDKHITNNESFPNVILLDINMPVTEGWEFIEAFEKIDQKYTSKVRLYIYTSSEYYKDIERAKSYASVKNIFLKPLNAEMIEEICDISR